MKMCKNCIHQNACQQMCDRHIYPFYKYDCCDEFADKESYIVLPYKRGDTVWIIENGNVKKAGIVLQYHYDNALFMSVSMRKTKVEASLVYGSKEAAETALKKMRGL